MAPNFSCVEIRYGHKFAHNSSFSLFEGNDVIRVCYLQFHFYKNIPPAAIHAASVSLFLSSARRFLHCNSICVVAHAHKSYRVDFCHFYFVLVCLWDCVYVSACAPYSASTLLNKHKSCGNRKKMSHTKFKFRSVASWSCDYIPTRVN